MQIVAVIVWETRIASVRQAVFCPLSARFGLWEKSDRLQGEVEVGDDVVGRFEAD